MVKIEFFPKMIPDTEGSFMAERAYQIAQACAHDVLSNSAIDGKVTETYRKKMNPNVFLANILYFRVCSYTEQIAVINYMEKFLAEERDVSV